jgi:hypothetical protein
VSDATFAPLSYFFLIITKFTDAGQGAQIYYGVNLEQDTFWGFKSDSHFFIEINAILSDINANSILRSKLLK